MNDKHAATSSSAAAALRRRPRLSAIALALLAGGAQAQAVAEEEAERDQARALDAVVVTGTRALDRTVAESLSPIDLIPVETLRAQASPEINAALARLVPSFNFPRPSITDGTDHVRPAQLRGLAPDQVLVLVNGKRRHTTAIVNVNGTIGRGSSPVDLNTIPVAAIERIEVLRDGASALYGSDAIAGVINIVLRSGREGGSLDARYGEHKAGDGELVQVAASTSLDMGAGHLTVTAEYRDRGFTNRARPDPRQQYPLIDGQPDPREATINRLNHRQGDADVQDRIVFFNGGAALGDDAEFYAFGSYGQRDGESAGFFRRPLDPRNVPAIHPDGFLPLIVSDSQDRSLVGGVRATTAGGWRWDASLTTGGNDFAFHVANSVNAALGAASPTRFYAGSLTNGLTAFNLDLGRGVEVGGLAYPLNLAVGLEYRQDQFRIRAGQPESYFFNPATPTVPGGAQVFPGFRPSDQVDVSRDAWSVYLDLEADLSDRLAFGAAVRHEDYSDFGSTTSGKLSGRYALTDALALRGTASTGFRAPSLAQQYYSTTATTFINIGGELQPFEVRTFPVTDPVAQLLGAEPLKAEKSSSLSLGLSAALGYRWTLTVDAYRIDIDDRILLSENLVGTPVRQFLVANGFPNASGGRYFTNAADTRTRGVDLVASGQYTLGAGELGLTLAWNWNDTEVTRLAPNPASLQQVDPGLQRIGRAELGRIQDGAPTSKGVLGLDYRFGAWDLRLGATLYGKYTTFNNTDPALDQTFGRELVVDVAAGYRFGNGLRLTVGADNVFDAYPDEVIPANSFNGILPYSTSAPFGYNGAFYYARVDWTF